MPLFQKARGKILFVTTDHNMLSFEDDATETLEFIGQYYA